MVFVLKSSAVTTYRPSSSGISPTPSMSGSQDPRPQGIIEKEIMGATYYVDLTAKNPVLSAEPGTVRAVTRDLKTTLDRLTDEGESSPTDPRLPKSGFRDEPSSYEPFVQLLNKIIDTASKHIPPSPLAPLSQLRFHRFGKEVKETYGSQKGLKPGGVGILGPLPTDAKELSWEHIEVSIESEKSVRDMVQQSGTYARCCLIGNQRRFFSLVIGFNFSTLEAYVFLFHRSGLSSSRALNVTTQGGFEGLVSHIVGIISIKDEAAYGLDPTRIQNMSRINGSLYELVRLIYVRESLRGRATIVYSLQGTSKYTCGFWCRTPLMPRIPRDQRHT
jgi:protein kinase-like protein